MSYWTNDRHISDLGLQLHASGELETGEVRPIREHLHACSHCARRAASWGELLRSLTALRSLEPGPRFDEAVMARIRLPATAQATRLPAWIPKVARQARRLAIGTAAVWSAAVIGGLAWLVTRTDVSGSEALSSALAYAIGLLWAGVVKLGAVLHLSGLLDAWRQAEQTVPGPGILSAVALMTAISGLALWTLYKVVDQKPMRVKAHA